MTEQGFSEDGELGSEVLMRLVGGVCRQDEASRLSSVLEHGSS